MQFFQKLVLDRDRTYAERLKVRTISCDVLDNRHLESII